MRGFRLVITLALCHHASGFGIMPPHESVNLLNQAATHLFHQAPQHHDHLPAFLSHVIHQTPQHQEHLPAFLTKLIHHSRPHDFAYMIRHAPQELLRIYTKTLAEHPLVTKMATGATLAVAGDAIAQKSASDDEYDTKRAASFAIFDSAYRALQHVSFPIIVATCHGQFLSSLLPQLASADTSNLAAAAEQTLASQLGIVPFMYYPAFFILSAAVQGLNAEDALVRAKENFVPLMQRNLLFWLPVQFIQFSLIPEDLQIPFLSVAGLGWTFILSMTAGSAKKYATSDDQQQGIPTVEQLAPPEMEASIDTDDVELEKAAYVAAESVVQ